MNVRVGFSALRSVVVPAVLSVAVLLPSAASALTSGDAYATQNANACSWTMGTAGIEKTVALAGGSFTMTSLKNKVASPTVEDVQGSTASDEVLFSWDGTTLRGSSGGWTCGSGAASTITVGGQSAIQLDIAITRTGLEVTKHYIIYPSEAIIREWTTYKNTSAAGHTLAKPSLLQERVLGSDTADTDLMFMTGASAANGGGSWTTRTAALTSTWERDFDSYDAFSCATVAGPQACTTQSWQETSSSYIPWFALHNRSRDDGTYFGLDYHGRWQTSIGKLDGAPGGVSMTIPNYSATVAAGSSVTTPKAFTAMYSGDLDDMTNRILDWQYRYMWDDTRAPYFANIRMLGDWEYGAQPFADSHSTFDATGSLQKVFGLIDHMRQIGADGYHRDYGWWDAIGSWNGPDWRLSHDYLDKSGMSQTIYYPAYDADGGSKAYNDHPSWFAHGSPCGYGQYLADLSIPAAATWLQTLLTDNAAAWGDYAWRNDACPVNDVDGATQLAESDAFVAVSQGFLDARPGSSLQSVDSGGTEIGYEFLRRASSTSFTDFNGQDQAYDASRLFPADKLSGIPNDWYPGNCVTGWNMLLGHDPDFTGETSSPTALECMRKLTERYHYLTDNGVVGRWVRQYHPAVSQSPRSWFERLSQDGSRGVLLYSGEPNTHTICFPVAICESTDFPGTAATGNVTVYPKGLNAASTYSVTYELGSGSASRTGSDLMTNGIVLSRPAAGEIVYLGMPKHPGSGRDSTAPGAPSSLTARYATNMDVSGVDLTWPAGTDDNYVSHYDVFRDGTKIATVSKGRYYFDHSSAASTHATYGVKTIDGDANASSLRTSTPTSADRTTIDDAAGALTYHGTWSHTTGNADADAGTLSTASSSTATVTTSFTGTGVTWFAKLGPDEGRAVVRIDGGAETTVDLFAPDDNNWRVPVFTRTFNAGGTHRITIAVTGTRRPSSSASTVSVDGLQIRTSKPATTEDDDAGFTYGGTGWKRPTAQNQASTQGVTATGGVNAYDFANCHAACQGFTPTQGANNWSYQDYRSGAWTNMSNYLSTGYPTGPTWHDDSPSVGGWVYAQEIHPGSSNDTARVWTAPRPGTIDIWSRPAKVDPAGDGVTVKITKNGTTIAGARTIAHDDVTGTDMDVFGVTVATGDRIRFEINNNTSYSNDLTYWDPELLYRGVATCALACQGFSGDQGSSDWRYQDRRSGTWGDIASYAGHSAYPDGATWHDDSPSTGGWVYRQDIHPGSGVDTARAWVAPRAGTVDITGTPAKVDPGGNGVVVQITKNGSTMLAGPRTIPASDTAGSPLTASSITVGAGDVIRFEISDNGSYSNDLTHWDPNVVYQSAAACHLACQQFAPVQGHDGWRYQDLRNGSWGDMVSYLATGYPTGPTWHDDLPSVGGWVYAAVEHPGQYLDSARTWIAPTTGVIDISSVPRRYDTSASGDGVVVKVTRNGQTILGPRTIAATDGTGSAFDVSGVHVAAGDAIRFEINRNSGYEHDQTTWDPDITYTSVEAVSAPSYSAITGTPTTGPVFAQVTVTGNDIELIGRTCAACGEADVYVDGVYDSRIDTYAFRGPDAWQVPIWHRSFSSAGSHTIKVVATGTKALDATGTAVFVDAVQAATS